MTPPYYYMVEMCAIVLPIAKIKLEIAEVVLEHGAGTWCNGAACNDTECNGTACNAARPAMAQPAM